MGNVGGRPAPRIDWYALRRTRSLGEQFSTHLLGNATDSCVACGGLPAMLDYSLFVADNSLYNTPNTFGLFMLERVLAWMEAHGSLEGAIARNRAKAGHLYAELDRTGFWRPHAEVASRSWMNVTWRLPTEALEEQFVKEAKAAGLDGLKGHRSVGGIRASLYNALSITSVETLVDFMRDFEKKNG